MNSIDQRATGLRRAIWIGLSLLLIAAPAQANRIIQVRVGNHPTFTRLVFEMESSTGYQVERRVGTDGAEQLIVTLEASTHAREITSKSVGIESVRIAEGADRAVAKIQLRKSGFQMKEMILSNPPRIVLDFVHSAAAAAELTGDPYSKPEPKPVVAKVSKPKPEPKPVVEKVAKPKPEPKPVVEKVAEPKPEPKPVVAKADALKPAPSEEEIAGSDSAQGSDDQEASLGSEADRRAAQRAAIPGAHKRAKRELPTYPSEGSPADKKAGVKQLANAADKYADAPLGSRNQGAKPSKDIKKKSERPSPSDVTRRIDPPKSADSGLPFNTVTLAGIAAVALILVIVAVRLFRRRSLPNDLDVTTFADGFEDDDAEANDRGTTDRVPAEGFSMEDSPAADSAPQVEEQNTAAYSLSEVSATATEPDTGLYNEDPEGEKPMDMETNNLPTERDEFAAPPAAAAAVTGGGDGDVAQLIQELAGRITSLEARLDEANDGRERLERQVAAQSEELRVQRAAIARTQRALRSLSRTEEDQATEPALREPSQPAG